MNHTRIHSTANTEFFKKFVLRYPDKQYQTWLGAHLVRVGIDYDYDSHLLDNITAAIISHFGDMSLPAALKKVRGSQANHLSPIPRFEQLFDAVEKRFYSTSFKFLQGQRPDDGLADEHQGIIHAELFMLRALSSFQAARRLINWGYFSEPLTILRSVLEQLAWAYAVGVLFDQKQLSNPNPSKCVGTFKTRFPAAGQLYGALSRFSHMEFEAQKHFVTSPQPVAGVMHQSIELKFFGLLFYSLLMIAYHCICRDFQNFYRVQHKLHFQLHNVILPIRHLVGHALLHSELDRDEITAELSLIYFNIFPPVPKATPTSNDRP